MLQGSEQALPSNIFLRSSFAILVFLSKLRFWPSSSPFVYAHCSVTLRCNLDTIINNIVLKLFRPGLWSVVARRGYWQAMDSEYRERRESGMQ